jgi:hypothetical protein
MEGLTGGSLSETAPLKPLPVRGDSSLSPAIEPRRMPIFNCSHIPMRSFIGIESKAVCSAQSFSGRNFIATKRGPANALHSGDPAYSALPAYFDKHLKPVLEGLLATAITAGTVRPGIRAGYLLRAVSTLCQGPPARGLLMQKGWSS